MLIDAHSHLDRFELEGAKALESALGETVERRIFTVSNSLDLPSFRRNQEIAESCDLVLPAFGVHPWYAPEYAGRLRELDRVMEEAPVIGEIGLDHHFVEDASAYPEQERVFESLLRGALEQGKLVTVHTKGAEREVLAILDRHGPGRLIVHWYSGPLDVFRELLDRGAYFTVGVELLFSEHLRTIARTIPLERLLTETDNPGGPKGFLGRPGTPLLVEDVVRGLAEARGATAESIEQAVQSNFLALTKGDPRLAAAHARVLAG